MDVDAPTVVAPQPLAETPTIERAALAIGLTTRAIQRKIQEGVWVEGRQYHRGKDGRIYIDMPGVAKWVRQGA